MHALVYVCVYIYIYLCVCVCVCMCVGVCVCMHDMCGFVSSHLCFHIKFQERFDEGNTRYFKTSSPTHPIMNL